MRNLHLDSWLHSEALSIHQLQREDSAWGASDAGGELPVLLQNCLCPHPLPTGVEFRGGADGRSDGRLWWAAWGLENRDAV